MYYDFFEDLFSKQKQELNDLIKEHLKSYSCKGLCAKKWVKSAEVCEMLSCSPATLFRLRNDGILPCSLIQGTYYYCTDDIINMMEKGRLL